MPTYISIYKPDTGRRTVIKSIHYHLWFAYGWRLVQTEERL